MVGAEAMPLMGNEDDDQAVEDLASASSHETELAYTNGVSSEHTYARNHYVALCAAFSAIGGLIFGFDQGVVSVLLVLPQFLRVFGRVEEDGFWKGLLTAMIELGALFGAFNQGWIADKYSRKYSIVIAVCIFTIGSIIQTAAGDYTVLVVARFIGGLGIGMLSMVVPLYISEISPPEIRGALLVLEELSIVTGIVIAWAISYMTRNIPSNWSWRLPLLLQIVPGLVLGFGIVFLPFSPRWLASKSRDKEALASLAILRSLPERDHRVQSEYLDIATEVALHKAIHTERHPHLQDKSRLSRVKLEIAGWTDCLQSGPNLRRTAVGVGVMFFQQFVGINALIYYSPTLFKTMGLDHNMQLIMSGVLNTMQLVGVCSSIWTMDLFGRRSLLMGGSILMTLSHIIIAVLVGKYSHDWSNHPDEGWASVAMLMVYMVRKNDAGMPQNMADQGHRFRLVRAGDLYRGRCHPRSSLPRSERKVLLYLPARMWLNNFIIGLITPPLVERTGYGAYIFFAVFCLLSLVWTYFFVPETMGKTLEQMDQVFDDHSSESDKAKRKSIMQDIIAGDLPSAGV